MSAGVVYEFTGSRTAGDADDFTNATFTLTLPASVVVNTDFLPGAQLTCNMCNHVEFIVDAVAAGFTTTPSTIVSYGIAGTGSSYFFYFDPGVFSANGVYNSILLNGYQDAVLTVSGAGGAVPEPSTLGLALAGVGVLALRLRRR
jgi:hypothetical protein